MYVGCFRHQCFPSYSAYTQLMKWVAFVTICGLSAFDPASQLVDQFVPLDLCLLLIPLLGSQAHYICNMFRCTDKADNDSSSLKKNSASGRW